MKKKLLTLLTLLVAVCSGAWAQTTGTDVLDQSNASGNTTMSKTASTLEGTYIAGQGGGNITNYSPSNKGIKLRTQSAKVTVSNTEYGYAVLKANAGYTLNSVKLEGTSNGGNSITLNGVYADVDLDNLATSIAEGTNLKSNVTFPDKNSNYVSTGEITTDATSNIVFLFPSTGDNQLRVIITVEWIQNQVIAQTVTGANICGTTLTDAQITTLNTNKSLTIDGSSFNGAGVLNITLNSGSVTPSLAIDGNNAVYTFKLNNNADEYTVTVENVTKTYTAQGSLVYYDGDALSNSSKTLTMNGVVFNYSSKTFGYANNTAGVTIGGTVCKPIKLSTGEKVTATFPSGKKATKIIVYGWSIGGNGKLVNFTDNGEKSVNTSSDIFYGDDIAANVYPSVYEYDVDNWEAFTFQGNGGQPFVVFDFVFATDTRAELTSFAFSGGTTTVTTETTDDFVAPTLAAMDGENDVTSTIAADITYGSNNTSVATVDPATGVVSLTGTAGTAKITATLAGNPTYSDNSAEYTITVNAAAATEITAESNKFWNFSSSAWSSYQRSTDANQIVDNMEVYKDVQISGTSKTIGGTNFSKALQLRKDGDSTKRQLHIKVAANSMLSFYVAAGGGDRNLKVTKDSYDSENVLLFKEKVSNSGEVLSCGYVGNEDADLYIYNNGTGDNLNIFGVKVEPLPSINLNTAGYGTFSYGSDVEIVGADAYTAALDVEKAKITCTKTTDNKVPAGAGVLLYGESNATVYLCPASNVEALASTNNLHGTTTANGSLVTMGSNTYYVLSGDSFVTFNGSAFTANKAYFEFNSGTVLARNFSIVFEDESTGIAEMQAVKCIENGKFYNLNGQQVAQPTKGLYIVNGRKVVMK